MTVLPITNSPTAVLSKYFRFRTLPGSEAAAQRLPCLAASCPATLWLHVWHLTPTQPAECLIFWACPVLEATWDRLTWAVCSGGPACRQPSMRMTSTWTPTERPPALPLCAWRPRSTVQPYLGQHEVTNLQDGAPFVEPWTIQAIWEWIEKTPKSNVCEHCDQIIVQIVGDRRAGDSLYVR